MLFHGLLPAPPPKAGMANYFLSDFETPSGIYRLPDLIPKSYTLKITGELSFYQSPLMTWRALFLNWSYKEGAVGRPGLETSPRDSDMPGRASLAQDSDQ